MHCRLGHFTIGHWFLQQTRCHLYRCLYIHLEYTTDCNIVFDESLFEFVMVDVADGESELLRVGAEKFLGMLVRWFEDTRR